MPFRGRFGRGRFGRRAHFGGGMHGHPGSVNPMLAPLVPFMFIGFMGSFAISIASTALANEYVEDS